MSEYDDSLKQKIDQVLKTLTYREREIIKLRYGLCGDYPYTQEEVGRIFKVSSCRARQIEAKAVRKLHHPVRSRQFEEFRSILATEGPIAPADYLVQKVLGVALTQGGPNLFDFATSELSQDAFICWLLARAYRRERAHNAALHQTAVFFLNRLLSLHGISPSVEYKSLKVERQYKGLDILVLANDDIALLIEDKTDTNEHSEQLPRYLELVRLDFPDRQIAPVYLKTGDQTFYNTVEDAGWKCFLRQDLLDVLRYGKQQEVESDIFRDFYSRLMQIDQASWRKRLRERSIRLMLSE